MMRDMSKKMTVALFALMMVAGLGVFASSTNSTAAEGTAAATGEACCTKAAECCPDGEAKKVAKVGEKAPNFTLTDTKGTEHSLADFKDKVVAMIWIDETCPFMVPHLNAGTFNKLAEQYSDVQFLLIDSNKGTTADKLKTYAKKYELKGAALYDPEGKVGKLYEAKTTPHAYVINTEGTLVYNGALDNAPLGNVQGEGALVNYVAKTIDALKAGKAVETAETKPYGCSVKYGS